MHRLRRLGKEHYTYTEDDNALPCLHLSSTCWLRSVAERLDCVKLLISGPEGTPYENGLFLFDCFFPASYPHSPPKVNIITTGRGTLSLKPNLYDNGKL